MSRRRRTTIDLEIKSKRKRQGAPDPAMQRVLRQIRRSHRTEVTRKRNKLLKESQLSPQEQRRQQVERVKRNVEHRQAKPKTVTPKTPKTPKSTKVTTPRTPKPSTVLREQIEGLGPTKTRSETKPRVERVKETTTQPLATPVAQTRYEKMVDRANSITDIGQLKKIIYNRNYRLKQNYIKEHPEALQLKYMIVNDLRHIKPTTFKRINAIKDPKKQIEALRKLIIDTTRKVNKPRSITDYSNKEQEYMKNSIYELQNAINSWDVGQEFREDLNKILSQITLEDINRLFENVGSYWAIGSGYYYAAEDFSHFVEELIELFEDKTDDSGSPIKVFTPQEKKELQDRLFHSRPDNNVTK